MIRAALLYKMAVSHFPAREVMLMWRRVCRTLLRVVLIAFLCYVLSIKAC